MMDTKYNRFAPYSINSTKKPLAQLTKNLALPNIIPPKNSIIQENQRNGGMDIHFQLSKSHYLFEKSVNNNLCTSFLLLI